jgi:hypothetical protein
MRQSNLMATIKKWGSILGIIAALGGAIPVIFYGFSWVANQNSSHKQIDTNITDLKSEHQHEENKLDDIAQSVSELKGGQKTEMEILKTIQDALIRNPYTANSVNQNNTVAVNK